MKARPYTRLSVAEKERFQRDAIREPAVVCPHCETQTSPADLMQHVEDRCLGPRAPHPQSRWITFSEALKLGVPRTTLSFWTRRGWVRFQGGRTDQRYLMRDVAVRLAWSRQRREYNPMHSKKGSR